jgi:hypothetical protein
MGSLGLELLIIFKVLVLKDGIKRVVRSFLGVLCLCGKEDRQ